MPYFLSLVINSASPSPETSSIPYPQHTETTSLIRKGYTFQAFEREWANSVDLLFRCTSCSHWDLFRLLFTDARAVAALSRGFLRLWPRATSRIALWCPASATGEGQNEFDSAWSNFKTLLSWYSTAWRHRADFNVEVWRAIADTTWIARWQPIALGLFDILRFLWYVLSRLGWR